MHVVMAQSVGDGPRDNEEHADHYKADSSDHELALEARDEASRARQSHAQVERHPRDCVDYSIEDRWKGRRTVGVRVVRGDERNLLVV